MSGLRNRPRRGVCRGEYGANGCDIPARLCPLCQQGKAGEVLREAGVGLFEEQSLDVLDVIQGFK